MKPRNRQGEGRYMTRYIPIHRRGKMWCEIDPVTLEIKMKRGPIEVVIDLKPLVRGIWEPVREIQVIELPPLPPGAGVEAVKAIAASSPFRERTAEEWTRERDGEFVT